MDQFRRKKFQSEVCQSDQSIIKLEDLSNELFYEIFDYLNGNEVLLAFSNLNHHLQGILHSPSFLFRIHIDENKDKHLINKYKEMIDNFKHRIISFHLSTRNSSLFPINSSFNHLQSLSLIGIHPQTLPSLLTELNRVSRLHSLTIDTWNSFDDLETIYRSIFALPVLKFYKFTLSEMNDCICEISLPMAKPNQLSTIQYLEMTHSCSIDELGHIVSYTPELRHLKFINNDEFYSETGILLLPHLTHLSISANQLNFDDFEMFIKNVHCSLEVLHFTVRSEYKDTSYLDAPRWEQLILQSLPQLKEFAFEYYRYGSDEHDFNKSDGEHNRLTSPFWLSRRWIYQLTIDDEQFIHSVIPYKKRWYEHFQPTIDHSSLQPSQSGQMIVMGDIFNDNVGSLFNTTDPTLILTQFHHLIVDTKTVSIEDLVELLCELSNVISLKLRRVAPFKPFDSSEEDSDDEEDEYRESLARVSQTNQITEVYLEQSNDFKELDSLLGLCRHVKHIYINSLHNINIESFIREILIRITDGSNKDFCLLCLRIPTADDQLIEKFKKIIDSNARLIDYTIKRVMDKIHLQWKLFD